MATLAPLLGADHSLVGAPRAYRCRCGRPIFFRNTMCVACGVALGYEPASARLIPIESASKEGTWREAGVLQGAEYRICANLHMASGCNWLIEASDPQPLCQACRLNRTIPNLSELDNAELWNKVEVAKRRLVSSLVALGLPVRSRVLEDPEHGLAFDILRSQPDAEPVMTGHEDGIITLNLEEADDAARERNRHQLGEPYRTLLGHLRHEVGHYYWDVLIEKSPRLEQFRELFGDDRLDYGEALKTYYANGPLPAWQESFVSAYATSHPWEDWAETWAHYLHMTDAVASAASFGVIIEAERMFESFDATCLGEGEDTEPFLNMVNSWTALSAVSNELARSMGHADFYPFVLSRSAVAKLYFVHQTIHPAS